MEQTPPPHRADEVETLRGFLDYYRATILRQAEGLSQSQLAQTLPPSTMTLGGMLKHLAGVEDWWFGEVFRGAPRVEPFASADWDGDVDWDWESAVHDEPDYLRDLLTAAIARSDAVLEAAVLDDLSVTPSRRTGEPISLRWIVVHLIEEYARHAGHADLIRESIDGAVAL
ncbi:MAG: DinB family protein [Marmoricola sp.]